MPEIKDELVGFVPPPHVDQLLNCISMLRKRDFLLSELEEIAATSYGSDRLDVVSLASVLYECSALGNIDRRPSGRNFFSFKFRNRHSTLNPRQRVILHRGIWKAMNLV